MATRIFAMDFSKAFDNVRHILLSEKLKALSLDPFITNWCLSFLRVRKERVIFNGTVCEGKIVKKGTTQGSVSGPYSSSIYFAKYADDATLVVPITLSKENDESSSAVNEYMDWVYNNCMPCNLAKCNELIDNM